ncbi:actin-related protein T3 [Gracilinanus agilis]|uniref:actin-related protein T3 n=1 Tax=Gracilinanus agilis TaxID=191870 RepID=UPI001CFCFA75|nr:actin-related protein T3 [Gracilinanus agilis]
MNNYSTAAVIDNGSSVLKAGLAGNREPQFIYANIVGRAKGKPGASESSPRDLFVGEEAQAKRCSLSISYPVERGLITSWADMEAMWRNVYENNLKMKSHESPVMLTEPAFNPLANREKMTELFFENFEVPALYVSIQPVLALFASGYTTGYVLDSGAGVSQCVPIFEGYCLPHGVLRLDLAGRDLTDYLIKLLQDHGILLLSQSDKKVVKNIKENYCYVAANFEDETTKNPAVLEKTYKLPDGKTIKLHDEMFRCPESLFLPGHLNLEAPGIDKLCYSSIMKCDMDLRNSFFSNIVLAGGSTCFPGLDKRLVKELALMVPANTSVRVSAPPDRKVSGWMGGSILASLPAFQDMWITTAEFKEVGANIIHQRCF